MIGIKKVDGSVFVKINAEYLDAEKEALEELDPFDPYRDRAPFPIPGISRILASD